MRIAALVFKYWSLFLLNVLTNVKKLLSLRFVTHLFVFGRFFFFCVLALLERYVRLILPLILLFSFSSLMRALLLSLAVSLCFVLMTFFFSCVFLSVSCLCVYTHFQNVVLLNLVGHIHVVQLSMSWCTVVRF